MALEVDKLSIEDRVVLAQSSGLLSVFEDPISFEIMVQLILIQKRKRYTHLTT